MIDVKICGITSYEDALMAIDFGASAIGIIFYKDSLRYIRPSIVERWIKKIPKGIYRVGVFVNEEAEKINSIVEILQLDFIQLHGDESPNYCEKITAPIIKAFCIGVDFNFHILNNYNVHTFLFDTYQENQRGGTGKVFNWDIISNLNINKPIILSGGLNAGNVIDGISTVQPSAIDINSGVESNPGIKDRAKLKKSFNVLKGIKSFSSKYHIFKGELA